jgi:hypothetical protein
MTMPILELMTNEGDSVYYSEKWRLMIETHLPFLINHPYTAPVVIQPFEAYKFEGDLEGLLALKGVPVSYNYIVMRMNGYTSGMDFKMPDPPESGEEPEPILLLTPSSTAVETLRAVFQTASKKIS